MLDELASKEIALNELELIDGKPVISIEQAIGILRAMKDKFHTDINFWPNGVVIVPKMPGDVYTTSVAFDIMAKEVLKVMGYGDVLDQQVCRDTMSKKFEDEFRRLVMDAMKFDTRLIFAPPYMTLEEHKSKEGQTRLKNRWLEIIWENWKVDLAAFNREISDGLMINSMLFGSRTDLRESFEKFCREAGIPIDPSILTVLEV